MRCFAVLLACCFLVGVNADGKQMCFQQRCKECPRSSLAQNGQEVTCDARSIVSESWLDALEEGSSFFSYNTNNNNNGGNVIGGNNNALPDNVPNIGNMNYSCIAMTSGDSTIGGDNLDIVRGCVPMTEAKQICRRLTDIESGRNKKSECTICNDYLCNGSIVHKGTYFGFLITVALALKGIITS